MNSELLNVDKSSKGQSLAEVLLAITLFCFIGIFIFQFVFSSYNSIIYLQKKTNSKQLASESYEALLSLRNQGWTNIPIGTYGLSENTGSWQLALTPDEVNGFKRDITLGEAYRDSNDNLVLVGTPDPTTRKITSRISWEQNGKISESIFSFYLNNWPEGLGSGNYFRGLWHLDGTQQGPTEEVLQNSGFESYSGSSPFIDFADWSKNSYSWMVDFDTASGYNSNTALKTTIRTWLGESFIEQEKPAKGGEQFTLSFWARGDMRLIGDPGVKVSFYKVIDSNECGLRFGGEWKCTGKVHGDYFPIDYSPERPNEWTRNTKTFTTMTNSSSLSVIFYSYADEGTYIALDDVSISQSNPIAKDETSFNNHGYNLPSSVAGPVYVGGNFGQAISFDGSNDYLRIPFSESISVLDQITLEAWVYPRTNSFNQEMEQNLVSLWDKNTNNRSYRLYFYVTPPPYNRAFRFEISPDGINTFFVDSITAPQQNQWFHLVGVYNGSELSIYVNGVKEKSIPYNQGIYATNGIVNLKFGSGNDNSLFYLYQGYLDEVSIQSVGITDSMVLSHYNNSPLGL